MKPRIDFSKAAPKVLQSMLAIEAHIASSGLEPSLRHLIKMRASQLNGCAYCIDMHSKDALAEGENTQRLFGLDAWRETPYYTDRERAALEWTEAVTLITEGHVPDEVYERVRAQFSELETVNLTVTVMQINAWNRLAIALRAEAGTYRVGQHKPSNA
jgi:AhpD family alkylhydroperoxidase